MGKDRILRHKEWSTIFVSQTIYFLYFRNKTTTKTNTQNNNNNKKQQPKTPNKTNCTADDLEGRDQERNGYIRLHLKPMADQQSLENFQYTYLIRASRGYYSHRKKLIHFSNHLIRQFNFQLKSFNK